MKKVFLIAVAAFTALTFISCGSGSAGSNPKAALTAFMKAMSSKDFTEARKYVTRESQGMMSLLEGAMAMSKGMNLEDGNDPTEKFNEENFEIGDAQIDGNTAKIPITEKKKGETTDLILKKEDGAWKVAFDMTTLSDMAKEKAAREGQDLDPELMKEGLERLTSDSNMKKMQEGLRIMDSLQRAMKK